MGARIFLSALPRPSNGGLQLGSARVGRSHGFLPC